MSYSKDVASGKTPGPIERAYTSWGSEFTFTAEALKAVYELAEKDRSLNRSDGSGRFRGSIFGACDRMQICSFLGMPSQKEDIKKRSVMTDGTWRHYFWQAVGLSAGFLVDIEYWIERKEWLFAGQIDGVMAEDSQLPGRGGFELKTMNSKKFQQVKDKGSPFENHLLQVGAYCEIGGFDWFSVVYEKRDFMPEFHEYVVRYDDELQEKTLSQFERLLKHVEHQQFPPIKPGYPGDNECSTWCSFVDVCPQAQAPGWS